MSGQAATPTSDMVLGFGCDTNGGWAVLASDGMPHPAASPTILHWLQVASAHQRPVQVNIEPDPFGTISYVTLDFDAESTPPPGGTMSGMTLPPSATADIVPGFGSDATTAWVVLGSDGNAHPCANGTILQQLQVSAAHQTPVQIVIEPDPFGTISYVYVSFATTTSSSSSSKHSSKG